MSPRFTGDEPVRRRPARKDTRRWCKGKPGSEHVPVIERPYDRPCERDERFSWAIGCNHHEVCATCGKVLRWSIDYAECPDLTEDGVPG